MATKIDLDKLSLEELKELEKETKKAVAGFEARKRVVALAAIEAVAAEHGYKLADLISGKAPKAAAPAKYRHPENPSLTWSGRGRQPKWIKEGLAAGQSLDAFEI